MPGSINVDTTNETVTLAFADHAGNPAPEPAGASVTFTSDNEAVLTVATDPTNPLQGDVTPLTVGQANLGASLTGADGNPLLEADGVTPFPAPDPVLVTVSAGAAESASLSLSV